MSESVPRGNRPAEELLSKLAAIQDESENDGAFAVYSEDAARMELSGYHEQVKVVVAALRAERLAGRQEAEKWFESEGWFRNADRLTAIIESRMSSDLAWLNDDGVTVTRRTPELVAHGLIHLYRTGDTVSGLPGLDEVGVAGLTEEGS